MKNYWKEFFVVSLLSVIFGVTAPSACESILSFRNDLGTYQIGGSEIIWKESCYIEDSLDIPRCNYKINEKQSEGDELFYEYVKKNNKLLLTGFKLNETQYSKSIQNDPISGYNNSESNQEYVKVWFAAEKRLNYLIPQLESARIKNYKEQIDEVVRKIENNNLSNQQEYKPQDSIKFNYLDELKSIDTYK
jgi:hypothetical protein